MLDPIVSLSVGIAEAPGSYAAFIGAGASRDAGVPTGTEVFWLAVGDLYRLQQQSAETPPQADLEAFLAGLGKGDWTYSRVLEALAPEPATRRDYLAKHFDGREPGETHTFLAELAERGHFRVFITTNFDRLLEHALQARGIEPVVVTGEESLANAVPREHAACFVLKLHGDYLQQTIRNTADELEQLPHGLEEELRAVLNRYGLVVIGYSGADAAIGRALSERQSRYGLYWQARGGLENHAAAIVEAAGGRLIVRPDSASFLRDLSGRLEVFAAHPTGLTPETINSEIVAALRRGDDVGVGELLRTERAALDDGLRAATAGRHNESTSESDIRELHDTVAPLLERRLLGLLPLVDYAPDRLKSELEQLAAVSSRQPRLSGTVFWLDAFVWPWWWLTHVIGAYALRSWQTEAMRALLGTHAVIRGKEQPIADGFPGETAHRVGAVMCPLATEGHYWPAKEWEYLRWSVDRSEALRLRYPELFTDSDDPKRALGDWNFILDLSLGLKQRGSVAYWAISPDAAQSQARRFQADARLRTRLAEDVLGISLEELDEQAAAALGRSHINETSADKDAAHLFVGLGDWRAPTH